MKTLFKDNLYKCVFINCNKYFKMTFKLITPYVIRYKYTKKNSFFKFNGYR